MRVNVLVHLNIELEVDDPDDLETIERLVREKLHDNPDIVLVDPQ